MFLLRHLQAEKVRFHDSVSHKEADFQRYRVFSPLLGDFVKEGGCSGLYKYLCTPQNETPITIRTVFPLFPFFRSSQERLMNEQYLAAVAAEPLPVR